MKKNFTGILPCRFFWYIDDTTFFAEFLPYDQLYANPIVSKRYLRMHWKCHSPKFSIYIEQDDAAFRISKDNIDFSIDDARKRLPSEKVCVFFDFKNLPRIIKQICYLKNYRVSDWKQFINDYRANVKGILNELMKNPSELNPIMVKAWSQKD